MLKDTNEIFGLTILYFWDFDSNHSGNSRMSLISVHTKTFCEFICVGIKFIFIFFFQLQTKDRCSLTLI